MKINLAQQIYVVLGVDVARLKIYGGGKRDSYTKSGPGRRHKQGNGKSSKD